MEDNMERYETGQNFCMALWLQCYTDKSIDELARKKLSYSTRPNIMHAEIGNDVGGTSGVNEEDTLRKMKLNAMIHELPMMKCTIKEGKQKHRFYFSLFEKYFNRNHDIHFKFFLFKGEENENIVKNVELDAYMVIDYVREDFEKQLSRKMELQLQLKNTNNELY